MSVRSVWNNFWCSGEKHGLFMQILQMFVFHMYFADKESIVCYLLVLSIKYLFLHVLAQYYYFSKSYCS